VSEPQTGARRYPRTFGGLIASMIVLVLAVLAYYVLQNVTHDQPETKPVAVDYLPVVKEIQGAGYTVAYPSSLPKGWMARDEDHLFTPGDRPVWNLPMLTAAGRFVGVQQEDAPLRDLLDKALPKGATQGEDVTIDSAVTRTWSSWSDGKRDHAYAATVGRDTLLVYGSAPVADLERLVGLLTTARLP
jgi:hypothetical protein